MAALRRVLGVAGIVLLGGALAYAPVAAFHDDMPLVSKAGIAGAALVLIAWLLPAPRGRSSDDGNQASDRDGPQ